MSDARERAIKTLGNVVIGPTGKPWTRRHLEIGVDALEAAGWRPPEPAEQGVGLIATERRRQVHVEGWTPEHDDEHDRGELAAAAIAYTRAGSDGYGIGRDIPLGWPWHADWWKPSEDPIRNLVKAGALIAAEIDRRARAVPVSAPEAGQP